MSALRNLDAAVTAQFDSAPATLPSAFLAALPLDDMREDTGWDARHLFGDEAPLPRFGHPEDLDQDDIPTVKLIPELPGDEPAPDLLARAEPISPAPAQEPAPAHASAHEPDERITFTFVRDPIPAPDFKARLIEVHRRTGFIPRLTLPPIGPVSIGLILTMVMPQLCTYSAMPSTQPLLTWWLVEQHHIQDRRA